MGRDDLMQALNEVREGDHIVHLSGAAGEVWFVNLDASPGDALIGVRLDKEGQRRTWRHHLWRIPLDQAELVHFGAHWLLDSPTLED